MTPLQSSDRFRLLLRLVVGVSGLFRRPYWPPERTEAYQLALLKQRLAEAKANVPLYESRDLPSPESIHSLEDWSRLPLVTKQDLINHADAFRLNSRYRVEDLIVSKSSGSTGQALDVYYDRESFYYFVLAGF